MGCELITCKAARRNCPNQHWLCLLWGSYVQLSGCHLSPAHHRVWRSHSHSSSHLPILCSTVSSLQCPKPNFSVIGQPLPQSHPLPECLQQFVTHPPVLPKIKALGTSQNWQMHGAPGIGGRRCLWRGGGISSAGTASACWGSHSTEQFPPRSCSSMLGGELKTAQWHGLTLPV